MLSYNPVTKWLVRGGLVVLFLGCLYMPYGMFGVLPLFTLNNEYAAQEDAALKERHAEQPAPKTITDDMVIGDGKPFVSAEELALAKKDWMWCGFCHYTAADAPHRIGPNLNGIIGRRVGSKDKYFYTEPFRNAAKAGVVWTEESLDAFIADPAGTYPGNRMRYAPVTDPEKRARIIKYLKAYAQ
jgi:cytochrome c